MLQGRSSWKIQMARAIEQIPSISDGGGWGEYGYILELQYRSNATLLYQMVYVGLVFSLAYVHATCEKCDVFQYVVSESLRVV